MFTFIFMYLCLYYLILFSIFFYIWVIYKHENIQLYRLNIFFSIILNYITPKWPIFLLLFILAGLPPVSFFFIKINFLLVLLPNLSIIMQLLVFINLLLGMFFYLQVFNTTNNLYFITKTQLKYLSSSSINLKKSYNMGIQKYKLFFLLSIVIGVNFSFFFIFPDYYIIFLSIF